MAQLSTTDHVQTGWLDEANRLVRLSGPVVLTNLGGIIIQTTDVVMIGWLGAEELAASALAVNVRFVLFLFAVGVIAALSPMLAQSLGRRRINLREVRRTVRQGIWAALVLGIPISLLIWRIDLILLGLQQDQELIDLALPYARAAVFSFIPELLFIALRNFITALERPAPALVVSIIGIVFNALANYGLIFGAFGLPELGLLGAGIATSLTQCLLFLGLLGHILIDRRFRRYRLLGRVWRADWQRFFEIWRLGLPIAVTLVMEVGLFSGSSFLMGWIGTLELAAHQIALQCAAVTFMVPLGLGQAATIRVGLAAGRHDADGVYRAGMTAIALGILFMAVMAGLMLSWPEQIVALFLDETVASSRAVAELAVTYIILAAFFQVFDAGQAVSINCLRGLKDTKIPMVYAMIGYWIVGFGFSGALAFGAGLGGVGVWTSLILALLVVSVLLILRFVRRYEELMVEAKDIDQGQPPAPS